MRALVPAREACGQQAPHDGSWAVANSLTRTNEPVLPQVKSRSSDPCGAARRTKVMPMK